MKNQNSLRQRFISMMYIILIAMLFIDPPVDFLETFSALNKTIKRANNIINEKNDGTVTNIKNYTQKYGKKELEKKIKRAEKLSDSTIKVLDSLKNFLVTEAGGYNKHGYLKRASDASLSTRLIYRTDRGVNLQRLLRSTKDELMNILPNEDRMMLDSVLVTNDSIPKATGIYYDWESYYFENIPLSGVIATLSKFQNDVRIAKNIAMSTAKDSIGMDRVTSPLYAKDQTEKDKSEGTKGKSIDTIELKQRVKRFEIFSIGEKGITKVNVPDIPDEKLKDTKIYTYDEEGNIVDSTKFHSGSGKIELKTDEVGEYEVRGEIAMKEDQKGKRPSEQETGKGTDIGRGEGQQTRNAQASGGGPGVDTGRAGPKEGSGNVPGKGSANVPGEGPGTGQGPKQGTGRETKVPKDTSQYASKKSEQTKKIEFQYEVVNPKPFISQEKFNVLYKGVPNPIDIYHPLIDKRDHRLDISNGKILYKDENYYAWAYRKGEAVLSLKVRNEEGEMRKVAQRSFKVEELPEPEAMVHNKPGGEISSRIFKSQKQIKAKNTDIDAKISYKVVGYKITYINGQSGGILSEEVKGSRFSGEARSMIEMAQSGDIYIFDEIKVKSPDGKNMTIEGIVFNII